MLYQEYTTSYVLVMEYIEGCGIDDKERLLKYGYDLKEIGTKLVDNYIKQVMEDGFFHADPHSGNVKIRDGKIIWLDMGMMGRLTEHDREMIGKAVQGVGPVSYTHLDVYKRQVYECAQKIFIEGKEGKDDVRQGFCYHRRRKKREGNYSRHSFRRKDRSNKNRREKRKRR